MKNIPLFYWISLLTCVTLLIPTLVLSSNRNDEIEYLLQKVEQSDCLFQRNGKQYSAQKAAEHLRFKYAKVKSRILTADDFVTHIASKSSISNKPYFLICSDASHNANDWLTKLLTQYRNSKTI